MMALAHVLERCPAGVPRRFAAWTVKGGGRTCTEGLRRVLAPNRRYSAPRRGIFASALALDFAPAFFFAEAFFAAAGSPAEATAGALRTGTFLAAASPAFAAALPFRPAAPRGFSAWPFSANRAAATADPKPVPEQDFQVVTDCWDKFYWTPLRDLLADGQGLDANQCELLEDLYDRFNTRDMRGILALLRADVLWANGMEGGYVRGHDGVCLYWTRQLLDATVGMDRSACRADGLTVRPGGEIAVKVHQGGQCPDGGVLSEKPAEHIFRIQQELVSRFGIGIS